MPPISLTFINPAVREVCERGEVADKLLGSAAAAHLRARLADIQAAQNVAEVPAGRATSATNEVGQLAFRLSEKDHLVLEAMNRPVPKKVDGEVDWVKVKNVRVVYVGNRND